MIITRINNKVHVIGHQAIGVNPAAKFLFEMDEIATINKGSDLCLTLMIYDKKGVRFLLDSYDLYNAHGSRFF